MIYCALSAAAILELAQVDAAIISPCHVRLSKGHAYMTDVVAVLIHFCRRYRQSL